jgi:hypothetical protein
MHAALQQTDSHLILPHDAAEHACIINALAQCYLGKYIVEWWEVNDSVSSKIICIRYPGRKKLQAASLEAAD